MKEAGTTKVAPASFFLRVQFLSRRVRTLGRDDPGMDDPTKIKNLLGKIYGRLLETVFFEIGDIKLTITSFIFQGFLTFALFFVFFLALDAQTREGKNL